MRKLLRFSGSVAFGLVIASATVIVGYELKARYVHTVWTRNQSRHIVRVSCGWYWSNVNPNADHPSSFGGIGKIVNCTVKLPTRSEQCSVVVASFRDIRIEIGADESVICDQLYVE